MLVLWPSGLPKHLDSLTKYAFTSATDTYFCSTCGSQMFAHLHTKELTLIRSGVLQNAGELVKFRGHIFLKDTKDGGFGDWLHEIDGEKLSRAKESGGSEELPRGWRLETIKPNGEEQQLPAYCHCKGVEFYITRPDHGSKRLLAPLPDVLVNPAPEESELWWLRDHNRYLAGTCACNSCRLAAGIDIVQWAFVPAANIKLSNGDPFQREFGTIKSYQSRDDVTRCFCGRCGANVFWTGDARPELIDVAVGLLDAASGARAEEWLFWGKERVSFGEDAPIRGLVDALGKGLAASKD